MMVVVPSGRPVVTGTAAVAAEIEKKKTNYFSNDRSDAN